MKILVIDGQISGAAGDMFLSALLDLYFEEKAGKDKKRSELINEIAQKIVIAGGLKGKAQITVELQRKNVRALEGVYSKISLKEPHRHLHFPEAMNIIEKSIKSLNLSKNASTFCKKAITILFEAEAEAHGEPFDKVHLHEAGSLDTFLDIVGSAYLLEKLKLFKSYLAILPINLGSGSVTFSHGTLPVPAPAVEKILIKYKLPSFIGKIKGEMFTPTGAIIIAALIEQSKNKSLGFSPAFTIENVGVGFGTKELENSPNALRMITGSLIQDNFPEEIITLIETNVDDCSGEVIGFLSNKLLDMGAKDVFLTPIYMKKGRPGTKISVLCKPEEERKFAAELMNQTSTIGVRLQRLNKIMLKREIQEYTIKIDNRHIKLRAKVAYTLNGELAHFKPEFDDIKKITKETGLTMNEVNRIARAAILKKLEKE